MAIELRKLKVDDRFGVRRARRGLLRDTLRRDALRRDALRLRRVALRLRERRVALRLRERRVALRLRERRVALRLRERRAGLRRGLRERRAAVLAVNSRRIYWIQAFDGFDVRDGIFLFKQNKKNEVFFILTQTMFTTQTCSIFMCHNLDLTAVAQWELDDTLVYVCFRDSCRGIQKRPRTTARTFFTNTITMLLRLYPDHAYTVNAKVSQNGTIQLTGCKQRSDAICAFNYFWIRIGRPDAATTLVWYMTNMNISLTCPVPKATLARIMYDAPFPVIVIHEPFYCYSGLLFKVPLEPEELASQPTLRVTCCNGIATETPDTYANYVATLPPRIRAKKSARRYISFLAFSSGRINVSGIGPEITQSKIDLVQQYIQGALVTQISRAPDDDSELTHRSPSLEQMPQ